MVTHSGIRILDRYLKDKTLSEIFNVDTKSEEHILKRILLWAKDNNTKTVSVVEIIDPKYISDFKIEDIFSVNIGHNKHIKIGICKVYGNIDFSQIPQFMKFRRIR